MIQLTRHWRRKTPKCKVHEILYEECILIKKIDTKAPQKTHSNTVSDIKCCPKGSLYKFNPLGGSNSFSGNHFENWLELNHNLLPQNIKYK